MRAPRYQFPDGVRSATRALAERSVKAGAIPSTSDELDAHIAESPDVQRSLEQGGYGEKFGPGDLFPLFEVFVTKAGGTIVREPVEAPPRPAKQGRMPLLAGALVALLLVALLIAFLR